MDEQSSEASMAAQVSGVAAFHFAVMTIACNGDEGNSDG
jgi:hypothetical protein